MEADQAGLFKFLVHSAGYLKMWVDSTLVLDCWRQTWNPWMRKFKVDFHEGEKIKVRIEWIPDGGSLTLPWNA